MLSLFSREGSDCFREADSRVGPLELTDLDAPGLALSGVSDVSVFTGLLPLTDSIEPFVRGAFASSIS